MSGMFSLIISEVLLFITYFWGIFHFTLSPYPLYNEGIIITSGRMLVLTITYILACASCLTALLQYLINKEKNDYISDILCMLYILGECFASLQTTEYLHLEYGINDTILGTLFFCTTGLHFIHVIVGLIFLSIYFIRFSDIFKKNKRELIEIGSCCLLLTQYDLLTFMYWHFVEIIWLFLKFLFYTE